MTDIVRRCRHLDNCTKHTYLFDSGPFTPLCENMTSSIKYWGTRQRIPPTPGVDAYGAPADGRMDGRELVDKWQQFTIDAAQLMAPSCSFSRGHTHAPSLFICRDANDLLSGNFRTPEPSGTEGRKASAPHAPTPDES